MWNLFVRGNGNDFTQPWGQTVGIISFSGIGLCADVPREACTGFYLEPRVWEGGGKIQKVMVGVSPADTALLPKRHTVDSGV